MPATGAAQAVEPAMKTEDESAAQVSCEACFFGVSNLCTLPKSNPCATFRPQVSDMSDPCGQHGFS